MAVHLLQVTCTGAAKQVSATHIPVKTVVFQNNAANSCRIGDSTVTASKGILLAAGSPGGAADFGTQVAYNTDLSEWYIFGTNADVIDILYIS